MRGLYMIILLAVLAVFLILNAFLKIIRRENIGRFAKTALVSGTLMEIWNVTALLRGHWLYGQAYLIFPETGIFSIEDLVFYYVTAPVVAVVMYGIAKKITGTI